MYLKGLIDQFFLKLKGSDSSNPDQRAIATKYLNLAYKLVYKAKDWEYRKRTGQIVIIPNYITGTCSITQFDGTNESQTRTVVFAGSTLTDSMKGRYFQPQAGTNWYKILYVDVANSTIYLDTPVLEATAAGQTFKIWKRFYYLYSSVSTILDFGRWDGSGSLEFRSPTNIADQVIDISQTGSPDVFTPYGEDQFESSYAEGSISIAQDSNLVLGVGTTFLANVGPGDILTVGLNVFRVKRVESDTRIILVNYAPSKVDLTPTYTIETDNRIAVQFYNNTDSYAVLPYTFTARGFDLVHETKDKPGLPEDFDEVIIDFAEAFRMKDNDDTKWTASLQVAQAKLETLKSKHKVVRARYSQFAPRVPTGLSGRNSGLYLNFRSIR